MGFFSRFLAKSPKKTSGASPEETATPEASPTAPLGDPPDEGLSPDHSPDLDQAPPIEPPLVVSKEAKEADLLAALDSLDLNQELGREAEDIDLGPSLDFGQSLEEEIRPVVELEEDKLRKEILRSAGVLDEPTQIDLDSQEIENKLLGDLENFFQEQSDLTEGGAFDFPGFSSSGSGLTDDFSDWENELLDRVDDERLEDDSPNQWPEAPEADSELGQVRQLLLAREMSQLSFLTRILTRPSLRAEFISRVITEALLLRTRRDEKLSTVLAPTVEKIVTAAVRRDPETYASQIFPAIGPAIRRSISETFVSKLQDFNSTLEKSFSLRGLKWRLEALRVHKPFSEIVLLHTLLYHVEEIYLIHASTGLVLDHLISEEGGEGRDADMVAGMFTAIQEFIRDSFNMAKHESLDTLRFGDRAIFIRRTAQVYLACVVRGNPPESLNRDLQEALELMVVDCAEELENFNGDSTPFRKRRVYFQDFLKARYQDKSQKISKIFWLIPILIVLFFFFSLMFGRYQDRREAEFMARMASQRNERQIIREKNTREDRSRFSAAIERINQEPGLVVVMTQETADGRWEIICLRDSLARDPEAIFKEESQIPANRYKLSVRPFISLDEDIVRRRVREVIDPLPTVRLSFEPETGELTIMGTAPLGWIMAAKERAKSIPGVLGVSSENLTDPRASEMERLVAAINGVVIHFPTNKAEPIPEDQATLVEAVDNLVALEKLAYEMQMSVNLVIFGHADSTGQDRRNYELSQDRTKTVAALLYARGSSLSISNYGLGSQFSIRGEDDKPMEDADSRKIELRVRLAQGTFGAAAETR
ncbi:MAG: OmpA family protein [Deltaproteobacteria bacterium]|jgi:OOP family OmpA-OmpF porin|nr:OmpA family protein [Deltaproteobacteria bacterium]